MHDRRPHGPILALPHMGLMPTIPAMPRLHFSIRTLLILVTLFGAYFGCWELTKRAAFELSPAQVQVWRDGTVDFKSLGHMCEMRSLGNGIVDVSAPAPFVICRDRWVKSEYSLWLFGVEFDLVEIENDYRVPGGVI
jgi:hypothetical protein